MMQRHNGWRFWGWTSTVMLGLWACAFADMTFNTFSSQLIFKTNASQLLLGKAQNVSGWSDLSITKDFGRNTPASWVEGFASGAIISQSGGTAVPQIHLITANSNAVKVKGMSSGSPVTQNSIDGTTYVQYEPNHHVFHTGAWTVRGWVRFNNGFTVMPRASVIMDTLTTVSGGFDLRDTGTLILNNDMYLSHNVTLTSGGNIKGKAGSSDQANTIFMGGDLTLASATYARTLHIAGDWASNIHSGDLIIDGCGHTLNIGDHAQLFVDTNVTLTLRNMTICTGPRSINVSPIQLAATGSKLALDNVVFDLGADFHFVQGQIFVHNEVAVTGTSAFVYQSPTSSYITSGATWSFESGTTFSIAPATYTDIPYAGGAATSNNFVVLADQSAALSLNGCSLRTTYTGARFSKGMVLVDNKVAIDTQAGMDLNNTSQITPLGSTNPPAIVVSGKWSPDGRFFAVVYNSGGLQVFGFNGGGTLPTVGGVASTGSTPWMVAWSPDGRFLAVINNGDGTLQVYAFDGSSTPTPVGSAVNTGSSPMNVCWSPDGRFVSVVTYTGLSLRIYKFDGVSTPQLNFSFTDVSVLTNMSWSPDGRFFAICKAADQVLRIYQFDGKSAPTLLANASSLNQCDNPAWSPDGRFVAVTYLTGGNYYIQIFRFNGTATLAPLGVVQAGTGSSGPRSLVWSPDGRFLALVLGTNNTYQVFSFSANNPAVSLGTVPLLSFSNAYGIAWSPDGNFLIAWDGTASVMKPYRIDYIPAAAINQGFSTGLVFGDKAKGAVYDADVRLLGGAAVTVRGMVKDDSA